MIFRFRNFFVFLNFMWKNVVKMKGGLEFKSNFTNFFNYFFRNFEFSAKKNLFEMNRVLECKQKFTNFLFFPPYFFHNFEFSAKNILVKINWILECKQKFTNFQFSPVFLNFLRKNIVKMKRILECKQTFTNFSIFFL